MIKFEWDADKATANLHDHGISFEDAASAYRDPFGVEWIDMREDYGEERSGLLGRCGREIVYVA